MNLRIVSKFKDCKLQLYEKRSLFSYFSVNPHTPASRWRRLWSENEKKINSFKIIMEFFSPHHFSQQQRLPFRLFVTRQKLSNALKSLKSKKVYRNRPIERVSECHSPHHIYNSLLGMRSIHELIKERDLAKLQVLLNINFMMKTLALVSALVNVQQIFFSTNSSHLLPKTKS